jgi:hypothetical protein
MNKSINTNIYENQTDTNLCIYDTIATGMLSAGDQGSEHSGSL